MLGRSLYNSRGINHQLKGGKNRNVYGTFNDAISYVIRIYIWEKADKF